MTTTAPEPSTLTPAQARRYYDQGQHAHATGQPRCSYYHAHDMNAAWLTGWDDAAAGILTPPARMSYPTLRDHLRAWQAAQPDARTADIAAFCLARAAEDWWVNALELNAYTAAHLDHYAEQSARMSINALGHLIRADYERQQENAA